MTCGAVPDFSVRSLPLAILFVARIMTAVIAAIASVPTAVTVVAMVVMSGTIFQREASSPCVRG